MNAAKEATDQMCNSRNAKYIAKWLKGFFGVFRIEFEDRKLFWALP